MVKPFDTISSGKKCQTMLLFLLILVFSLIINIVIFEDATVFCIFVKLSRDKNIADYTLLVLLIILNISVFIGTVIMSYYMLYAIHIAEGEKKVLRSTSHLSKTVLVRITLLNLCVFCSGTIFALHCSTQFFIDVPNDFGDLIVLCALPVNSVGSPFIQTLTTRQFRVSLRS